MDFLDGGSIVIKNARIVTADRVFTGGLAAVDGRIVEVREGPWALGVDFEGDYLLPGLVELHTDHLEVALRA